MELGERIKEIRESKRIKLNEIAATLNVDVSNYAKMEKRGSKLPLERVMQIADNLGVSLAELLGISQTNEVEISKQKEENKLLKELNKELKNQLDTKEETINRYKGIFIFMDFITTLMRSMKDAGLSNEEVMNQVTQVFSKLKDNHEK